MPKIILFIIIALLGIPAGMLIAKYTKDEIRSGISLLGFLIGVCLITIIVCSLMIRDADYKALTITVSGFIFFLSLTSLLKGFC